MARKSEKKAARQEMTGQHRLCYKIYPCLAGSGSKIATIHYCPTDSFCGVNGLL